MSGPRLSNIEGWKVAWFSPSMKVTLFADYIGIERSIHLVIYNTVPANTAVGNLCGLDAPYHVWIMNFLSNQGQSVVPPREQSDGSPGSTGCFRGNHGLNTGVSGSHC